MRAQIKGPQGRERVRVAGAGPGSDAVSPAEDETCMRPQPLALHPSLGPAAGMWQPWARGFSLSSLLLCPGC